MIVSEQTQKDPHIAKNVMDEKKNVLEKIQHD
jgi:hypothetical protein